MHIRFASFGACASGRLFWTNQESKMSAEKNFYLAPHCEHEASICWFLQDKNDDLMIGVKSTALLFGDDTKDWLARFGAAMVGGLFLTGLASHQTFPYFLGVGYVAYHLHWQVHEKRGDLF